MGKNNVVLRNVIATILLQFVTIISGFVVPKVLLTAFGSELYGLTVSITQFLNYISLLEGGLSGVIMAALYKPLSDNDEKKVSAIVKAAQNFFRKLALIYVAYVCVVAIIYPLAKKVDLSYGYVCALTFVLAFSLFIQYFFSLTYKLLLNADRKVYYVSVTQIIITLVNMGLVIVCVHFFNDILLVKAVSALVFIIQPLLYTRFVNKHYKLDKDVKPDEKALSQRWDGFGQNLAYFIHSNTDVVVLTLLSTLENVAVYSVYLMIANALKMLVVSISGAVAPSMGRILSKDDTENTNKLFSVYELGVWFITSVVFTCGIVLIVPFITVYTHGLNDAEYYQPLFGPMIVIAEMICCYRDPYISLSYAAGHFKSTASFAYIEAVVNIVISILLVHQFGLPGVAIGTIISMFLRLILIVFYLKNNIINRSIVPFVKKLVIFSGASFGVVCLAYNLPFVYNDSYISWVLMAVPLFVACVVLMALLSLVFFRKDFRAICDRILRKV